MAPKQATGQGARPLYSRMVQPALPLLPGQKAQKPKAALAQDEVRKPDIGEAHHTTTNGSAAHSQAVSVSGLSQSDLSQDVSLGAQEAFASSPTAASVPITPQVSTPAQLDLATGIVPDSETGEEEPVSNTDSHEAGSLEETTSSVPSNVARSQHTEDAAVETSDDKEAVTLSTTQAAYFSELEVTGHYDLQNNVGDPGPSLYGQSDQDSTTGGANGTREPYSADVHNGSAFPAPYEQVNDGSSRHASTPGSAGLGRETMMNGYHQPAPPVSVPRTFNALPSLQDHLLHLATTKEGVDWAIQIHPPNSQPFVTYAHSAVVFRSLRLRRLMNRQQSGGTYAHNVLALYPARAVLPHAFEAALRFLYTDTVVGREFVTQPQPTADFQAVRVYNLDSLISYWISGIELGLEPVTGCAESLLTGFLDWDILDTTHKYAMELATSPVSSHGKNMTGSDYLVASSSIVKMILQFVANHIDIKNFKLDTSAASSSKGVPPRLPLLDDGRSRTNPALSSMVFGSMPSSADLSPSSPQSEILPTTVSPFRDTIASNILLNVDFENLLLFKNLLDARLMRERTSTNIILDIVNEREARRQKVYYSRVPNRDRMASSAIWEPVGLKEAITVEGHLTRERVGFLVSSK